VRPALPLVVGVITAVGQSSPALAVSDKEILTMVGRHCLMCHSQTPSHTMLLNQSPPKGVAFDSIEDIRKVADRIMVQVVQLKHMPLGNETGMTDEERAKFAAWIADK
jgi:uncharacterized membrane protein